MEFLKKWIGCILSFVAGVLGLSMSACAGMIVSGSVDLTALGMGTSSVDNVTKAFRVLTDSSLYTNAKAAGIGREFMTMKVFAIIALVISILLIVYSFVILLKNLNVIKSDTIIFDILGWSLVALFLIAIIGLLVSSNSYADLANKLTEVELLAKGIPAAAISMVKINVVGQVGLYQPFMLGVSIVLALVTADFAVIKRKVA